jgi:glycosyltransferase involved in cell wall biosynthesis
MSNNILVVDPILRGSRLVNSSLAIAGFLKQGWTAHLLTRHDAITDHYRELFGSSRHHLHSTIPVPSGVWFEKLSPAVMRCCLDEMERLVAAHTIRAVFFTGWNEFFPALPLKVWRRTGLLSSLPCLAIDYAPGFWLKPAGGETSRDRLKTFAKQMTTRLALSRFGSLKLLLLDERVLAAGASDLPADLRQRHVWIPDPAPVPDLAEPPPQRQTVLPTVLVIGLQTERKGLIDIVELIERNPTSLPVQFHFVGRLAKDTEYLRNRLKALPPRFFSWSEGFWPEQVVQNHYAAADFVILPYSRSFDCSSAVLAMACGHGKPVVVTEHGVIGYRVRRHKLGQAYSSRNISALLESLRRLPSPGSPEYQTWSQNSRNFALANSVEKFQEAVISLISAEVTA